MAALLIAIAFSRLAPAAAPLPGAILDCTKEQDDSKRLACFDREVARVQSTIGLTPTQERKLEPATVPPSPAAAPAAVSSPDNPGTPQATHAAKTKPPPPAPLVASTVSRLFRNTSGRYVIVLTNGQTWIQGEAYDLFDAKIGDAITIRHGLLGSFWMRSASGSETRVTRER